MKLLKPILIVGTVVGITGLAYFQKDRLIPLATPLLEKTKTIDTSKITEYAKFDPKEFNTISQRGQEVTSQATKVLGAAISESSSSGDTEKPLHTKALEYGRYLYCQEVVKEYEKSNPSD